jgi:hypothetical protein
MNARMTNYCNALLAATTLFVAACGGGSRGQSAPSPMNAAPQIAAISDRSIDQDTVAGPIELSIADRESGAGSLSVTASADGTSVFPTDGVVLDGNGAVRTLTLTPLEAATGMATITVSVVDPEGAAATREFKVSVNPRNASMRDAALSTFALADSDVPTAVNGVTWLQDADDPVLFEALLGAE